MKKKAAVAAEEEEEEEVEERTWRQLEKVPPCPTWHTRPVQTKTLN